LSNKLIAILSVIALVVVILAGFTWYTKQSMTMQANMNSEQNNETEVKNNSNIPSDTSTGGMNMSENTDTPVSGANTVEGLNSHDYAKNLIKPSTGQQIKKFSLIAKENTIEIKKGLNMPVWTYNGTVPGNEIRVSQGDFVQVELKNELKEPVTIHWHGYPLKSAMDGVPGLNQDSVKPGETFTYEFSADVTGTYWYHSHQESAEQVDKGLYGALIVEPINKEKIDKDYTLILDEWMENPSEGMESMAGMNPNSDTNGMSGMDSTTKNEGISDLQDEEMMSSQYNIYTVNGKSGDLISPLDVKNGDKVRLRFINAGYRTHGIHIPGQDIKVVSSDGQDINGAGLIADQIIMVAPGERYDIEFTVKSQEDFIIDAHDKNKFNDQLIIPVKVEGSNGKITPESSTAKLQEFDLTSYGIPEKGDFLLDQKFDVDYQVILSTRVDGSNLKYTINDKVFTELPTLKVKTGDLVKLTYENKSNVDHPMHLHGHFFQILSKNGKPLTGAAIIKDSLLIKPGEKYVVAFKADNTGKWVQHCHELHHASAGMMQAIEYTDYVPNYIPDPNNKYNKPE